MLKSRLIPKLQLKPSSRAGSSRMVLVTTVGFASAVEIGDPVSQAKIYEAQGADELIFLDLAATSDGREALVDVIRKVAEHVFMPVTVGGGVRSVDDARLLVANGADKICLNTAALDNPDLIGEIAEVCGTSSVVVSIDYRLDRFGLYRVYSQNGTIPREWQPADWAAEAARRGAGEILLTSIARDGTGRGLDVTLTSQVARTVSIPVITSGGCGQPSHVVAGFIEGMADAVAAGTYFCFRDQNLVQTRAQLVNAAIPVRVMT